MPSRRFEGDHIFINCPFDSGYKPIFGALLFVIRDLGFVARCALEHDDSGEMRFSKIERMVEECRFGIHDLSAVELDAATGLPRFNMPLELGLFLGCKRYGGGRQRTKACLILDSDPYRYRAFMSDISGHDIHAHGGSPQQAIVEVRNWLVAVSGRSGMPGGIEVSDRYARFQSELPGLCMDMRRKPENLIFLDLAELMTGWIESNR